MKRRDEAEERKQIEKETQKSVERTHWTLEGENEKLNGSSSGKLKFIIEYDNVGGISGTVRQSFKNFNKEQPEAEDPKADNFAAPQNKIPKLSDNKKKSLE
jgi:hypothetical protein